MKILAILLTFLTVTVTQNCSEKKSSSENKSPDQYSSAEHSTGTTGQNQQPVQQDHQQEAATEQQQGSSEVQTSDANLYRLTVSFYSIGAGTDYKTREEFEKLLNSYSPKVSAEMKRWGREGETDFCLKLKELNTAQQADFVKKARAILEKSKLVHIKENAACRE